jgi:hypothetical protein
LLTGKHRYRIAVALFVFVRLLVAIWSPYAIDHEETKPLIIAKAILEGPLLPLPEYQMTSYEGGLLLYGLLAVPFVALFGTMHFILKILAIGTATLWFFFSLKMLEWCGGKKLFWPAVAILTAAFPGLAQVQCLSWANFDESAALGITALYLWARHLSNRGGPAWAAFAVGAICGLGFTIHYGFLVTIAALGLFWFMTDPLFFIRRNGLIAGGGLLAGLSFFLWFNVTHHWVGLIKLLPLGERPHESRALGAMFERAAELYLVYFPQSFHLATFGGFLEKALSYIVMAGFAFAVLCILTGLPRKSWKLIGAPWPTSPMARLWPLAYLAIFTAVLVTSGYPIGYELGWGTMNPQSHLHLLIAMPHLLYTIALAWTGETWRFRRLAFGLVIAICGLGVLAMVKPSKVDPFRWEKTWAETVVTDYVFVEMGTRDFKYKDVQKRIAARLTDGQKRFYYAGVGQGMREHRPLEPIVLGKLKATCPERYWPYCVVGGGQAQYFLEHEKLTEHRVNRVAPLTLEDRLLFLGAVTTMVEILAVYDETLIEQARKGLYVSNAFNGLDDRTREDLRYWRNKLTITRPELGPPPQEEPLL